MRQVKGTIKIEEFTSHSEPDEYVYTVSADGAGAAQVSSAARLQGVRNSKGLLCMTARMPWMGCNAERERLG